MEKGFGKEALEVLTNIRGNTNKIKNKVMGYLLGKMEVYTKEII